MPAVLLPPPLLLLLLQVRNEAGQMVLAGPKKGAEEGAMYKKWAKHNKAAILATGIPRPALFWAPRGVCVQRQQSW
jgi:hypothetical protein